ncbi:MAG: putative translation initiation inhibitor, yjgF family [Blastococcus sp.]|jgi:2-iminobutanoate/2-iminopropanoate deaminase|nr:putative translation initiation inhibitor, yjgF family [Blastococcus sp.]
MDRQVVTHPGLPPSIGPYSHAVRAGGFVFVAGQPGLDPATGEVPGNSFGDEARQAFTNLATVLRVAGSSPELVVSTTVLVAELADFPEMNTLFAEFFPTDPPTRMTMQVLLPRGLRISIGCTAVEAA